MMSYPMTYQRVIKRNHLRDEFTDPRWGNATDRQNISYDLQRLEVDQRDDEHLRKYAALAGVSVEQVKIILDALFHLVA